jgi:glycogen(starch) synthase
MRVLLTTDTVGGVWTFTRDLSAALLDRGHSVCLVSFGRIPSTAQIAWTAELREQQPARFLYLASEAPLEWMDTNDRCWIDGSSFLQAAIDQFNPDVLHFSQFCFGALRTEVPKIITAHSDVLSWAEACRPEGLEPSARWNTYRDLVMQGLRGADVVVAPTTWMLHALQRNFVTNAGVRIIPNGRPLLPRAREVRTMQAVTLGRLWDEAKGIDTLLKIDLPIPIYIGGEQQFDNVSAPKSAAANVHWLGALSDDEVALLLQRSSIYLGPSRYEPFGLAPLEAALSGCALILRDLPGFREVWSHSALYFTSEHQLEEMVAQLSKDAAHLAFMQQAASQRAALYSVDRMTEAYLKLYREALDARRDAELTTHAA